MWLGCLSQVAGMPPPLDTLAFSKRQRWAVMPVGSLVASLLAHLPRVSGTALVNKAQSGVWVEGTASGLSVATELQEPSLTPMHTHTHMHTRPSGKRGLCSTGLPPPPFWQQAWGFISATNQISHSLGLTRFL